MSAPQPATDCLPGTACPTCFNMFGAPSTPRAPMKTQCGHLVCGDCAAAAEALKFCKCLVCKAELADAKYSESPGFARFAAKELARLHLEDAAAAVLCVECVGNKKLAEQDGEEADDPLPAEFTCEGCKGKDRALCEGHSHMHKKHASLKWLGGSTAPAATHCADHLGTPLTRMCLTCNMVVCADCCLTGAHPAATHEVVLLAVLCERLAAKVAELAPVLRSGAAGLAADSEEVLHAKAAMLREFEGSVEAVKAEVAALIVRLLAAQDAWIAQGRTIADARVKVLDDQATVLNVSAAQVSAGVTMLESVLGDAGARADPLTLVTALDSGSSLARLIGQRGGPCVSTTLILLCEKMPLELADLCRLRQERADAGCCEVVGPGLTGFIVGDAAEVDVTAQNYVDITVKDDGGAVVSAVRAEDVVVSVTSDAVGGTGGDGAPAYVGTVLCSVRGEGVIRACWVMSRDIDAALLAVTVRGGGHVRGSPFRLPNVTQKSPLILPKVLFLGLDNSGKTTLLRMLKEDRFTTTCPTMHPEQQVLSIDKIQFNAFDFGGHETARKLWPSYFSDVSAVIYFVDSNDREYFPEAKHELDVLLSCEALASVPFLILGNKIDMPSAASEGEFRHALGLLETVGKDDEVDASIRPIEVFMCSIVRRMGFYEGLRWLAKYF